VIYITYMLILATTFHGTGMSDLISAVYLFYAFYYILYFRRLYTKNSVILSSIRKYNIFVLLSILIFQIPAFVCPSVTYNDEGVEVYTYISKEECAVIMKEYSYRVTDYGTDAALSFYIVLT
jgi:hypothetical protein